MEYPKINSVYKREGYDFTGIGQNPKGKNLIIGDYACPEFDNIKIWDVEEKIDGTNIRIIFKNGKVIFAGRTSDAMLPSFLLEYLQIHFTESLMKARFQNPDGSYPDVILYGEGYGPKIQSGGYYSTTPGFCLFDAKVGLWWLAKHTVRHVLSQELGVPVPPCFPEMTIPQIVELVKSKPPSKFAQNDPKKEHVMEGVICRPSPQMLFRNSNPIMFKLKCKDML